MKKTNNVKRKVIISSCLIIFIIVISIVLKLTFFVPKPITEIKKMRYT